MNDQYQPYFNAFRPRGYAVLNPPQMTNGIAHLLLTGNNRENYVIQRSTNLVDWQSLSTNRTSNSTLSITDNQVTNAPQSFYRALSNE